MTLNTPQAAISPAIETRVRQAFLYTFPVHDLARTRWVFTQKPDNPQNVPPNVLQHTRKLLDHKARAVTMPNNDTLYSSSWLDLSAGPVVLSVPDMQDRYYSFAMMDIFTNNFACIGRRTTGTKAISFTITGPDWQGSVSPGSHAIRSPSNDVWLLGRILVDGEDDLAEVHRLQNAMRLEPLNEQQPVRLLHTRPGERTPAAFLALVNEMLGRNPVPAPERALVESFSRVGVRPGVMDAWEMLEDDVQEAWTSLLPIMLRELKTLPSSHLPKEDLRGHWVSGRDNIGNFGDDYLYRAFICLSGLGALERAEAIYMTTRVDAEGNKLNGEQTYRLHVPAGMPINAFWSLSMYEFEADGRGFFTENSIHRYTIGDRTPGLKLNADGSADIWLQHAAPPDAKMANWLPAPAGLFALALRFYQPKQALLDRTFVMPDVELVPQAS